MDGKYYMELGKNIIATLFEDRSFGISLYKVVISGSGAMYDSVDDFKPLQGDFNAWPVTRFRQDKDTQYRIVIPEGITTIADRCFAGVGETFAERVGESGVKGIVCPESLKRIGESAFASVHTSNIPKLQSITFGHNVEFIDRWAFQRQDQLKRLDFYGTPTVVNGGAFQDCHELEYIDIAVDWQGLNYGGPSYTTFEDCYKLSHINALNKIHTFRGTMYNNCNMLSKVTIDASDFDLSQVRTTSFGVDLYAGDPDHLDEEGYFITEINEDSYITPEMLSYDWKNNWHRIIKYVNFMKIFLFHKGRTIEIPCYDRGGCCLKNKDKFYWVKWRQLDDSNPQPDAGEVPLIISHKGHWYQVCY